MSFSSPSNEMKHMILYVHSWWRAVGSGPGALPSAITLCKDDYFWPMLTVRRTPPNSPDWAGPQWTQGPAREERCHRDWGGRPYWAWVHGSQSLCALSLPTLGPLLQPGTQWLPCSSAHSALFGFAPLSQLENIKPCFLEVNTFDFYLSNEWVKLKNN